MSYLIAEVLGVVLCLMLVYTIFDNRKRRRRINLSGPQTWPFVGNLLQLDFIRPDITMEEWGKKHNGLYRMRVFSTDIVVATSYDAVHEILVSKGKSFAGRGKPFRRMVITYGGKDMIIGNPTEPHWLWLRKASQKTMRQYGDNLTRIESLISQMADEFVSKVLTYNGRPVNIRDDIYNFTMKAAFVLIAGRKPDDGEPVLQLTKKFERALILSTGTTTGLEMDYFPWLRFVGHPLYKRLLETCRLRDQLWGMLWSEIQDRYASAKGSGGDEEGNEFNDLLTISAQMLDDQSSQYQPLVDEENIKGMFINVLGGSISTTTASAYSLLNILLHHPKVYQRLQQEVDTVIGFDRKPAVNDRDVMPFTSAVILELLRFTSMVPAFPHASIEDTTILGTAIPNGTPVIPLFSAVHHDEAFWGDPWVFRPDRFLAQDGNLVAADHPNRKHVLAFGAGPRVCVGEVFAMKRLFIFTTSVIQAFELQAGDVTVSCDPRLFAKGNVLFPPDYVIKLLPRKRIY